MKLEELPRWAAGLLTEQPIAHLGLTDEEGRPRVLPVTFAVWDGALWSAIDDKPKRVGGEELARVRWLRARPQAAITVDRYSDDWSRLAWVQVLGRVEIVEEDQAEEALRALAARYPAYRERAPGGPLLALRPERALCWRAEEN